MKKEKNRAIASVDDWSGRLVRFQCPRCRYTFDAGGPGNQVLVDHPQGLLLPERPAPPRPPLMIRIMSRIIELLMNCKRAENVPVANPAYRVRLKGHCLSCQRDIEKEVRMPEEELTVACISTDPRIHQVWGLPPDYWQLRAQKKEDLTCPDCGRDSVVYGWQEEVTVTCPDCAIAMESRTCFLP